MNKHLYRSLSLFVLLFLIIPNLTYAGTKTGWAFGKFIIDSTIKVNSGGLTFRSSPSLTANVLGILPNGTQVDVIRTSGQWKQISVNSSDVKARNIRSRPSRSKSARSYEFYLRASTGPLKGEIKGDSLIQSNLNSVIGFGGRVNFDSKRTNAKFRSSLGLEYYKYSDIQNLSLPATYKADLTFSYLNYFKSISPFTTVSFESIAALGGLLQDDESVENTTYHLRVLWFGVGATIKSKLPRWLARRKIDISGALLFSIVGTPVESFLTGTSSGIKVKFSAKIHASRRIFLDAVLIQNSLYGHASINNTEYIFKLGYNF
ncbi:MAG: SH3 domain-containing protein [Bacteriovoracaceae bacterium]|nr:SH3 domain-containing protein [Bacteriovoracaceae bacterium]